MLARRSIARAVAQPAAALGAAPANARNMATLREIELRLKSVRNIEKITKVWRDLWQARMTSLTFGFTVDENDCLHQIGKGPEGYGRRQEVRYCQ